MSQQHAIILMIDIQAAINAGTLTENTYLIDNMKSHGSVGNGTANLITAVNGAYWFDGSQAGEAVLNWLPYGIGALPPTLPRTFRVPKSTVANAEKINSLAEKLKTISETKESVSDKKPGDQKTNAVANIAEQLKRIMEGASGTCKIQDMRGKVKDVGLKVMDMTGKEVNSDNISEASYIMPIITSITGEAVDKGVMFPAQYGSPDLVTDGWYWSASVDTNKTGTFAYTMHIQIYALSANKTWVPKDMTYTSHINVTHAPKRNGFTGGAMQALPIS